MSKKRKRHQGTEEAAPLNDETTQLPQEDTLEPAEPSSGKPLTEEEVANVQKKIFHTVKEIGRAFKKARDFELRKIIKRIKAAKDGNDVEKVARLEKELQIAKSLDVHPFAPSYVLKKLQTEQLAIENPKLLENAALQSEEVHHEDGGIVRNLVGRLGSSAVVKSTMTTCLNLIYRAAGLPVLSQKPTPKTKGPDRTRRINDNGKIKSTLQEPPHPTRLEALSDEDETENHIAVEYSSNAGDDDHSDGDSEGGTREVATIIKSRARSPKPPKKITVLPSLSTGYIPASDSSDPDEEYASFAPLQKVRKNRRGQRERQAIWSKKYGSNARHLQPKPKEEKISKSEDTNDSRAVGAAGTSEAPVVAAKVNAPHPSWVAKQKLREQQKAIMTSAKPAKIVFE